MTVVINGDTGITQAGEFDSDSTMGFKNRIINGAMVIDQRNAGAAVTVNGATAYTVDRWQGGDSTDGAFSAQQDSSAPAGFVSSLKITTTTADATLTTTQSAFFRQSIEGTNTADLAWGTASAKTVTISFWVRSSLTGTFGGAVRNSDASRSYPFTYAISLADTWEQKSVVIEGDTSGTWLTTTGVGVQIVFGLGSGPDRSGTAGAWNSNNNLTATGAVSVIGTLNATWYITGVQLEKGSTATSFDYRPFGTELALCQRYFEKSYAQGTVPATSTSTGLVQALASTNLNQIAGIRWLVVKRASPTVTVWSQNGTLATLSNESFANAPNAGTWAASDIADSGFRAVVGSGGLTQAAGYNYHYIASIEL